MRHQISPFRSVYYHASVPNSTCIWHDWYLFMLDARHLQIERASGLGGQCEHVNSLQVVLEAVAEAQAPL